jgi:hypothetical protein
MKLLKKIGNRILWSLPSSGTLRGYDNPELADFIFRKTKHFRSAEPWPEMEGVSSVLDFGGGLGLHYHRAKRHSPGVRWAVVETPEMCARASELATENLNFFHDVQSAAVWLGCPEIVYSNGVLQFTREPVENLTSLCKLGAPKMIWQRVLLSKESYERQSQLSLLSENGPGFSFSRRRVEYDITRIPERVFLEAHTGYRLTLREGVQSDRDGESFTFIK